MNKNISKRIILMTTFLLMFTLTLSLSIKSYAFTKPSYVDWIRELYDYDEEVTDEEIIKEKGFEDETGRVFFKNPSSLAYELFTGKSEVIGIIKGYKSGYNGKAPVIDMSKIVFNPHPTSIIHLYQFGNYNLYGTDTIHDNACGPASLAMVVDSLTNLNYSVEDMCNWSVENGYWVKGSGSKRTLMSEGARKFGLVVQEFSINQAQGVVEWLASGYPVVMITHVKPFTDGGHFIVLAGIEPNGDIIVNDPFLHANNRAFSQSEIFKDSEGFFWGMKTPN